MIKDLLRKLQRITSLQDSSVQHRVFNLFFRKATVEAFPLFVWNSFSQISLYFNIPHTHWKLPTV